MQLLLMMKLEKQNHILHVGKGMYGKKTSRNNGNNRSFQNNSIYNKDDKKIVSRQQTIAADVRNNNLLQVSVLYSSRGFTVHIQLYKTVDQMSRYYQYQCFFLN